MIYFENETIGKFVFWTFFIDEVIYSKLHHVVLIIILFADISPAKAKDR